MKSFEAFESVKYPPFCRKNDWFVDPKKVVLNPAHSLPDEEEEELREVITEAQESVEKSVQFASYVDVHMRCPVIEDHVHYPSKMIEELKHENSLLIDDLLIAEKRIEQLEAKLKRTKQELVHARTINETLPLWILVALFVGLVVAHKYAQLYL